MAYLHVNAPNPDLQKYLVGDLLHELRARGYVVSLWSQADVPEGYSLDHIRAELQDALNNAGLELIDARCPDQELDSTFA